MRPHLAYLGSLEAIAAEKVAWWRHCPRRLKVEWPSSTMTTHGCGPWQPAPRRGSSPTAWRQMPTWSPGRSKPVQQGTSFTVFVKEFLPVPGLRGKRKLRVHISLLGRHPSMRRWLPWRWGWPWACRWTRRCRRWPPSDPCRGGSTLCPAIRDALILDDSYSASLASTLTALDTLALFKGGRRCAVLGDLPDLGSIEGEAYRRVGERAARVVDSPGDPGGWSAADRAASPGLRAVCGARSWWPTLPRIRSVAWSRPDGRAIRSWSRGRSSRGWSRSWPDCWPSLNGRPSCWCGQADGRLAKGEAAPPRPAYLGRGGPGSHRPQRRGRLWRWSGRR